MIAESHTLNREGKHVNLRDAYLSCQVAQRRAVTRLREQTRDYDSLDVILRIAQIGLDKVTITAIKSARSHPTLGSRNGGV